MNRLAVLVASSCLLGGSIRGALAQAGIPAEKAEQGQFGFRQPNGTFVPLQERTAAQAAAVPNAVATIFKGKFVLDLTIAVISPIPAASKITCSANLSVSGYDSTLGLQDSVYESVSGITATRTGATASCKVVIPYYWRLYVPDKDKVNVSFGYVSAQDAAGNYRSISVGPPPEATQMPLPPNGTVTTINHVIGF